MKYILALHYKGKIVDEFISKKSGDGMDEYDVWRYLLSHLIDSNLREVGFRVDDALGYRITNESGGVIGSLRWPSDYELRNSS